LPDFNEPHSLLCASKGSKKKVMAIDSVKRSRPPVVLVFAALGAAGLHYVAVRANAAGTNESEYYQEALSFTLPVRDSMWIAARCSGAHTTPVYVKVNGRRFWKRDRMESLVARRPDALEDLDKQLNRDLALTHQGNWDGPEAWKNGAAALRQRIQIARQTYEKMRAEAR
jgi:hypothetical protein